MTGEMSQFDAEHNEEWALHRKVARAVKGNIHAFDVYQGPWIEPKRGGGRLWLTSDGASVIPVLEKGFDVAEGEPCMWNDEEGIIAMCKDVLGGVYQLRPKS